MENRQRIPGWIGPSYQSRAGRFDNQRAVNFYLEQDELGAGKGQEPAVLIGTPGLRLKQMVGQGPIRAVYTLSNNSVMYVVSGSEVYQLSGSLSTPLRLAGTLLTRTGPVSIADNGTQLIMVDGSAGYYNTIGSTSLTKITSLNFYPADVVTFQDGYFILNKKDTIFFFFSDLYDITFPPLNIVGKSGNSDRVVAAYSVSRLIYVFGEKTTEIWANTGASANTPFSVQLGRFSQIGCLAPHTIQVLGETLLWLGSNGQGGGIVYELQNAAPTRVSTHAVEFALQELGDLSSATAWTYQQEGHHFYCLNAPGSKTTWCYDPEIKQWHERQSTIGGVTNRHLAEHHAVLNGEHIVGDYRNGNLYKIDLDYHKDNNEPILRLRQSPHVSSTLNRMFVHLFEVDCEFGVGLDEDGRPLSDVNPQLVLRISHDGGNTWSIPAYATMGKIGEYKARARWQRLGSSRDFMFQVSSSDNVRVTLLSAFIDTEIGQS